MNTRRDFLKKTALTVLSGLGAEAASMGSAEKPKSVKGVSHLQDPAAIGRCDFSWLTRQMDRGMKEREEKARTAGAQEWKARPGEDNDETSCAFCISFGNEVLARLQAKWPELDFLSSLTFNGSADRRVTARIRNL